MTSDIDERLNNIKLKRIQFRKDNALLKSIEGRFRYKTLLREKAEKVLRKEEKEFHRINNLSFTSLFYSLLGSKEEKLDKERQEYLLAKLNFDKLTDEIELIISEKSELQNKTNKSGYVESEYRKLIKEKEEYLLSIQDERSNKLHLILNKLSDTKNQIKEIREALFSIEKVIELLEQLLVKLKSAKSWGTADILGGGVIVSLIKHGKIDDAKVLISKVQFELDNFTKEMEDIPSLEEINHSIRIGNFLTFSDYVFDGLISDFAVQHRINKSKEQVELFHSKSLDMRNKLSYVLKESELDIEDLNHQREQLL